MLFPHRRNPRKLRIIPSCRAFASWREAISVKHGVRGGLNSSLPGIPGLSGEVPGSAVGLRRASEEIGEVGVGVPGAFVDGHGWVVGPDGRVGGIP